MTTATIKAIETQYKGSRFRSRLEARWAVFFDALNVKWRYESEGFVLSSGECYLPDFWLPNVGSGCYVEIKPAAPSTVEMNKARLLAADSKQFVMVLAGDVWPDEFTMTEIRPLKAPPEWIETALHAAAKHRHWWTWMELMKGYDTRRVASQHLAAMPAHLLNLCEQVPVHEGPRWFSYCPSHKTISFAGFYYNVEAQCSQCGTIHETGEKRWMDFPQCFDGNAASDYSCQPLFECSEIRRAFALARGARFEHGDRGGAA